MGSSAVNTQQLYLLAFIIGVFFLVISYIFK